MEKKTAKVVSATLLKGKDGNPIQNDRKHYFHIIVMDNKDKGTYTSVKDVQTYFVVGKEVEYEIGAAPKESNPNETYTKIKPFYPKAQVETPLDTPEQISNALDQEIAKEKAKAQRAASPMTNVSIVTAANKRAVEAWLGNGIGRSDIKEFAQEMAHYMIDMLDELNRTGA